MRRSLYKGIGCRVFLVAEARKQFWVHFLTGTFEAETISVEICSWSERYHGPHSCDDSSIFLDFLRQFVLTCCDRSKPLTSYRYIARSLLLFGRIPWSSLLPGKGFLVTGRAGAKIQRWWYLWLESHACRFQVQLFAIICIWLFFLYWWSGTFDFWCCFAGLQSLATGRATGATHRSMQRSSVVLPMPLPMLSYADWSCKLAPIFVAW